jgi:hypothetical protein
MQLIMNVRRAVLFVVLGLLGTAVPAVAQTCQWSSVGGGMNFVVTALTVFNDGTGPAPALYAGGRFTTAGDVTANYIAKWDGAHWSALGSGMNDTVFALTVFDDGTGSALYAGGIFTTADGMPANRVAKWDGAHWAPLGTGVSGGIFPVVWALTWFDDGTGPALYAGGEFTMAGDVAANHIAKWDGTQWSPLGNGVGGGTQPDVFALTVFDDAAGSGLYAGGRFTTAEDVTANHIAKWVGTQWSALGSGTNNEVSALTSFDDGTGLGLYAGGVFTTAGDVTANRIAKWDGTQWAALGSGTNSRVQALTVFDDGTGAALYAGDVLGFGVAKWDGAQWSALGNLVDVRALTGFDDGTGLALYEGSSFNIFTVGKWSCQ